MITTDDAIAKPVRAERGASQAWLRALELTTPIANAPRRTFPAVIAELAEKFGDAPALVSDDESLSFRALDERTNRYARWALAQDIRKGDTVCLLMANRPEYMAIWLGITRAGGVVALLNTNLAGSSLAHCIDIVAPKRCLVPHRRPDATSEVAAAITAFPGVVDANVYGVAIPGADGRAGMAEIVCAGTIDLAAFRVHLTRSLPRYAHPVLLRMRSQIDVTPTFKQRKHSDAQEGFDPSTCPDALYIHDPDRCAYVVLDPPLYERIRSGKMRL
jgi:acyl-CoA synthetase (AMP-forming)/AMP-acid ligase II